MKYFFHGTSGNIFLFWTHISFDILFLRSHYVHSLLFSFFVQISLRTITSLQHSEVTGCFSHWTVLSKWSIFNTILPFISNFRWLILHFFNKMLRKKKAKAIGQWEHSHGVPCSIRKYFYQKKASYSFFPHLPFKELVHFEVYLK